MAGTLAGTSAPTRSGLIAIYQVAHQTISKCLAFEVAPAINLADGASFVGCRRPIYEVLGGAAELERLRFFD